MIGLLFTIKQHQLGRPPAPPCNTQRSPAKRLVDAKSGCGAHQFFLWTETILLQIRISFKKEVDFAGFFAIQGNRDRCGHRRPARFLISFHIKKIVLWKWLKIVLNLSFLQLFSAFDYILLFCTSKFIVCKNNIFEMENSRLKMLLFFLGLPCTHFAKGVFHIENSNCIRQVRSNFT